MLLFLSSSTFCVVWNLRKIFLKKRAIDRERERERMKSKWETTINFTTIFSLESFCMINVDLYFAFIVHMYCKFLCSFHRLLWITHAHLNTPIFSHVNFSSLLLHFNFHALSFTLSTVHLIVALCAHNSNAEVKYFLVQCCVHCEMIV